jgi:hypothetical protein
MTIGRQNGQVRMRDINAEFNIRPAAVQIGLGQIVNIYGRNADYGRPYPDFPWQAPTYLSGISGDRGFHGYTHRSANFDGINDYLYSANTIDAFSTFQPQLTDAFTLSMWVRATRTATPPPNYAIPLFFIGGQNGFTGPLFGLYYSGRLSNGATEDLFIARFFRGTYNAGPTRDYRFRAIFTGGNRIWWNPTNPRLMNHILLQYDGAGPYSGAFRMWWNGVELGVFRTNNFSNSGGLVWTSKNLRVEIGRFPYTGSPANGAMLCTNVQWFRGYGVASSYFSQMYNRGAGAGPFVQGNTPEFHYWPLYINGMDMARELGASNPGNYDLNSYQVGFGNMIRPVL